MLGTLNKQPKTIYSNDSDLIDLTSIFPETPALYRYYSVVSPVLSDLDILAGDVIRLPVFNPDVNLSVAWIVAVLDCEEGGEDLLLRYLSPDGLLSTRSSHLKEPTIKLSGVKVLAGCPSFDITHVVRSIRGPFLSP